MEESLPDECTEALTRNLDELLADSDNDAGFKEEMIEEVMQEFYKEIIACPSETSNSPNSKVDIPRTESESLLAKFQDGGDEFVGLRVEQENIMENEGHFDDEWLARVLSWEAQGYGQVMDTGDWF